MEKTSEFLIYLMACSLQGTKPEEALLANIDMEALLRLAKAHSVSAMVCMALEQTDAFQHAAETTRLKWLDCKNKAVRKNMLLDAERHRLEKEFAEHGIWYMPLKGSILKDWYPKFGMREMADNDILFDATRRQQVRDIFVNRGYSIESYNKSSNHDAYEKQPIYNFEMHVALFHEDCSTLQKKYENVVDRLVQDEKLPFRYHFTPEDFYVFVVAHVVHLLRYAKPAAAQFGQVVRRGIFFRREQQQRSCQGVEHQHTALDWLRQNICHPAQAVFRRPSLAQYFGCIAGRRQNGLHMRFLYSWFISW